MSPAGRSKLALLLIAVAAFFIQRGATLPWGLADTADGRRIAVSPIGITQLNPPPQPATAGECRWWPSSGSEELCAMAPDGAGALRELRRVYPLMSVALWLAIAALFLQVLRLPRVTWARSGVTAGVSMLVAVALGTYFSSAVRAFAVLSDRELQLGTTGTAMTVAAALLALTSAWLHWGADRAPLRT